MVYVSQRQAWEYKYLTRVLAEVLGKEELNRLGHEGWELISVLTDGTHIHYYLKRLAG